MEKNNNRLRLLAISLTVLSSAGVAGQQSAPEEIQEIVITGAARAYSALRANQSMRDQQSPVTSALSVIDNLPGVNVTEGDTFGFDDWSTTVNLRGCQTSLSEQQVGTTIDGFPNGDSNYGGGAKANRYIDSMNLGEVEVNQGIASIGAHTTESLGGTPDFTTDDLIEERRLRIQLSQGDYDSRRCCGRYDSGRIHFVDTDMARLAPRPGCASTITFPYGGAGPEYDPACYPPEAIPVQSHRHSHYARQRGGVTADFVWETDLGWAGNSVSGGGFRHHRYPRRTAPPRNDRPDRQYPAFSLLRDRIVSELSPNFQFFFKFSSKTSLNILRFATCHNSSGLPHSARREK